jgi:glutaredoxin
MQAITVTIIGKEGCHLCDEAQSVIGGVLTDFPSVTLEHRVLDEKQEWLDQYADKIPVVMLNDQPHAYWRVKPERLVESLLALGAVSGKN